MKETFIEKKEVVGKTLSASFLMMLVELLGRDVKSGTYTTLEAMIYITGVSAGMVMTGVSEEDIKKVTEDFMKALGLKKHESKDKVEGDK